MASSICRGFCELAAVSRNASDFPWKRCSKIGKSARSAWASSGFASLAVTAMTPSYRRAGSALTGQENRPVALPERSPVEAAPAVLDPQPGPLDHRGELRGRVRPHRESTRGAPSVAAHERPRRLQPAAQVVVDPILEVEGPVLELAPRPRLEAPRK